MGGGVVVVVGNCGGEGAVRKQLTQIVGRREGAMPLTKGMPTAAQIEAR